MLKIDVDGSRIWRNEEGKLHRIEGPAAEYINGTKCWLINGKLHREDGPAMEYRNENKYWYLDGKQYSEKEYKERIGELC